MKIENVPFPLLIIEAELKGVSIVSVNILMLQGCLQSLKPPPALPDHLAQHPERRQQGLVLLPFQRDNTDGQPGT